MGNQKQALIVSLLANVILISAGCAHSITGLPVWNGEFWAGYSGAAEIRRTQGVIPGPSGSPSLDAPISAFSPTFDNYVCMTYADLSCLYFSFVENCKDWYTLAPSCPNTTPKQVKRALNWFETNRKKSHKKA